MTVGKSALGKVQRVRNGRKLMRKNVIRLALCAMFFALRSSAEAQQPGKIFRTGFLDGSSASGSAVVVDTFRRELRKLGWIEGKNFTIESRGSRVWRRS
jgi:hypothetical protein